jgi:FecR protein
MMRRAWALGAISIVAGVLAPSAAGAQEAPAGGARPASPALVPYTVGENEGCDTIAAKLYGDAQRYDIIHQHNPQLGPPPHNKLKPGTVLMVLPATVGPDARLSFVRNEVEVQAPTPKPGHPSDPLFRGNRVSTGLQSSAAMRFRDDTHLSMGEKTLVVILGATRAATQTSDATLVNGSLRARMAELAGKPKPVVVATDSGSVALGAGETKVSVDDAKATRLAVYKGDSTITAQKKTVPVTHGFGSKAEMGTPPTPPRPLPAAPAWTTPPPSLVFANASGTADVTGTYGPGIGPGEAAAHWHVQLAHDTELEDLIVDATVPAGVTSIATQKLPLGTYYVRASAVDADEFEGPYGVVATVTVAKLDWADAPGTKVATLTPAGLFCGVDGAALTAVSGPIAVETRHPHKLRCATAADGAAVATVDVAPDKLGPRAVRATWLARNVETGVGRLALALVDDDGAPWNGEGVTLASDTKDVHVTRTEPGPDGGLVAFVSWTPGLKSFALRVDAEGAAPIAQNVELDRTKAAPAAPKSTVRGELDVAVGLGVMTRELTQPGPTTRLGVGAELPVGPGAFAAGFQLGLEHYQASSADGAPQEGHDTITAGVPLAVRWGGPDTRLRPYLVVTPMLMRDSDAKLFGVAGALGGQLAFGPGAAFVEVGLRTATSIDGGGTPRVRGFLAATGYRLAF